MPTASTCTEGLGVAVGAGGVIVAVGVTVAAAVIVAVGVTVAAAVIVAVGVTVAAAVGVIAGVDVMVAVGVTSSEAAGATAATPAGLTRPRRPICRSRTPACWQAAPC